MALLRRAVAIAPADLGVKRNRCRVVGRAALRSSARRPELLEQIGVSSTPQNEQPTRTSTSSSDEPASTSPTRPSAIDVQERGRRRVSGSRPRCKPIRRRAALDRSGVAAHAKGLLDIAAERYERAYTLAASDTTLAGDQRHQFVLQARVNRAAIDHERGLSELAIEGYEAVLRLEPEHAQALNNLGPRSSPWKTRRRRKGAGKVPGGRAGPGPGVDQFGGPLGERGFLEGVAFK